MKLCLLILVFVAYAASSHERDGELRKIDVGTHPSYQSVKKVDSATKNAIDLEAFQETRTTIFSEPKNELEVETERAEGRKEYAIQIFHLFFTLLSCGPLTYTGFLDAKALCLEHLDRTPLILLNLFTFIMTLFHLVLLHPGVSSAVPYITLFALSCFRLIGLYTLPYVVGAEVCPVGIPSQNLFKSMMWEWLVYVPTVAQVMIAIAWIAVAQIWQKN